MSVLTFISANFEVQINLEFFRSFYFKKNFTWIVYKVACNFSRN